MEKCSFFWFRRDLRLHDNHGLYEALKGDSAVIPVFIFDEDILDKLENKADKRVQFIHNQLSNLKAQLILFGSDLKVFKGKPLEVWTHISKQYQIDTLYYNHDYEPYAINRDDEVNKFASSIGGKVQHFKDHVFYEKSEIVKPDGLPYTVYTPYSKKWKSRFFQEGIVHFPSENFSNAFMKMKPERMLSLSDIGFQTVEVDVPKKEVSNSVLVAYHENRDFPAKPGTSRLSVHLRFGTISIRHLVRQANDTNEKFLNELIWRDFYAMILHHFPHVDGNSFRSVYDRIEWRNDQTEFEKWCTGNTGIPIVDAGMRELNETGFMHNRVRMIVASFLIKNLLIDWRWGEQYFAEKLLDFDLASNNGGWQWAAGSGCDAAPYFRVFNPITQAQKFDPNFQYIKKWVPELNSFDYPQPMVDLKMSRNRALEAYKVARGSA